MFTALAAAKPHYGVSHITTSTLSCFHPIHHPAVAPLARHTELHQFTSQSVRRGIAHHATQVTLERAEYGRGRLPLATINQLALISHLETAHKTLAQGRRLVKQSVVMLNGSLLGVREISQLTQLHLVQQLRIKLRIVKRRVAVYHPVHLLTKE